VTVKESPVVVEMNTVERLKALELEETSWSKLVSHAVTIPPRDPSSAATKPQSLGGRKVLSLKASRASSLVS
jgi:hypothetical protein